MEVHYLRQVTGELGHRLVHTVHASVGVGHALDYRDLRLLARFHVHQEVSHAVALFLIEVRGLVGDDVAGDAGTLGVRLPYCSYLVSLIPCGSNVPLNCDRLFALKALIKYSGEVLPDNEFGCASLEVKALVLDYGNDVKAGCSVFAEKGIQ